MKRWALGAGWVVLVLLGCSAGGSSSQGQGGSSSGASGGTGGSAGFTFGGSGGTGGDVPDDDPTTCAEAAARRTYIGCDFWPTVTANAVWPVFNFAAVAANTGSETANVTVTLGDTHITAAAIPPGELRTLYLPWIPTLKGPESDQCMGAGASTTTSRMNKGAYHLVSDRPIAVYQFNPLEYASIGGPPGHDWTQCHTSPASCPFPTPCNQTYYTYTNDASLLLPSTAMTGNYRMAGRHGYHHAFTQYPEFMTVTATQDGTRVTVYVSPTGTIEAGGGVPHVPGGGTTELEMNAGDVVQLLTYTSLTGSGELSGSLLQANKPIQVISGTACSLVPDDKVACDHTEESLLPAETFGQHYLVVPPTGPKGDVPGHVVRIYGNFDNTQLSYPSGAPSGAPTSLNAGQWVDLGVVKQAFEVQGSQAFAVASFQLGGSLVDPNPVDPEEPNPEGKGDPSLSFMTAVEQYRTHFVFLAPPNYDVSYADVSGPLGVTLMLDGAAVTTPATPVGSELGVTRIRLGPGNQGAHVLTASEPVGLQVLGYGRYTSYQYPGGLNLKRIAPPPDTPR